jgi:hypothetical protein
MQVQIAAIASLVTGTHVPPCRLSIIKTLLHPIFTQQEEGMPAQRTCIERGCNDPTCRGNRLEVRGDKVVFTAPHHKNSNRGFGPIEHVLPAGILTELLRVHIAVGHQMLTQETGVTTKRLFVSRKGQEFNNSTFTQFWGTIVKASHVPGLQYFPPSAARNAFVVEYMGSNGMEPDMWDGAAAVMGNSRRQWETTYNAGVRLQRMQAAVDHHTEFRERVLAAADDSGDED